MRPRVVNVRYAPWRGHPESFIYMGRPGKGYTAAQAPFGNRFSVEEHGPMALSLFRKDFRERVEKNPIFREEVLAAARLSIDAGKPWGCFCVTQENPSGCHAVVMADWVEEVTTADFAVPKAPTIGGWF